VSAPRAIAVVGGGVTGLAAAWRLAAGGRHHVRLFEASTVAGGSVRTECVSGWLVEGGPNSLQEGGAVSTALLQELGLEGERIEASPRARHRYVVRKGRLVPVPMSPPALLASPLFSFGAKLRVLRELLTGPKQRAADTSVADFARQHFGREIADTLVQPFVSGIYAGDPERLSVREGFPLLWELERTHGSLLRGQRKAAQARRARGEPAAPTLISFRKGLQSLPEAMAARLAPGTIAAPAVVEALRPGAERRWKIDWAAGGQGRSEEFDAVILALPAWALARLPIGGAGPEAPRPLAALEAIAHPPVATLFLGYSRKQVTHPLDGFGVLIPASEKRRVLGVLFSSTLFDGRAPDGHVALTVLTGGVLQPEAAAGTAADQLALVRDDLRDLLGVRGDPVFMRHRLWPRAIPQYELGFERHRLLMTACENEHRGLTIGGAARDGIAVGRCIESGFALARRATGQAEAGA